jgi:phospholipid/cholesterol/gamma-HCH transport system substrate-binding protein
MDSINSGRGTIGTSINDPALSHKFTAIASDLQTITSAIASGKGSLGKLVNDDTLYTRANSAIDQVDKITTDLMTARALPASSSRTTRSTTT